MADRQLQEAGEAPFHPELSSALEAVLELGALGFHRAAADGQTKFGRAGIVEVVAVVFEVVGRAPDGVAGGLAGPGRVGQPVRAPPVGDGGVPREQFGGEGMQELAGVIEVQMANGADLEAVGEDIPEPDAAVHDDAGQPGLLI
jgi:hypothetical protein